MRVGSSASLFLGCSPLALERLATPLRLARLRRTRFRLRARPTTSLLHHACSSCRARSITSALYRACPTCTSHCIPHRPLPAIQHVATGHPPPAGLHARVAGCFRPHKLDLIASTESANGFEVSLALLLHHLPNRNRPPSVSGVILFAEVDADLALLTSCHAGRGVKTMHHFAQRW